MINVSREPVKETIKRYGDKQLIVAIEELSELQKELCKYLRGKGNKDHIIEEMADVLIMVSNIREYFSIKDDDISSIIQSKQQRTMNRMKENKV